MNPLPSGSLGLCPPEVFPPSRLWLRSAMSHQHGQSCSAESLGPQQGQDGTANSTEERSSWLLPWLSAAVEYKWSGMHSLWWLSSRQGMTLPCPFWVL